MGTWGTVQWTAVPGIEIEKAFHAHTFRDRAGFVVRAAPSTPPQGDLWEGLWWLWPVPVVVAPWHFPNTWEDLRKAATQNGIAFEVTLRALAHKARGKQAVILLLGFPMPTKVGALPSEVFWQALVLPTIPANPKPPKGFRTNDNGWWHVVRRGPLAGSGALRYLSTANWHPDRLQARGRLQSRITEAHLCMIGVGALGSAIAELLVRMGVRRLTLIDHDCLAAGNLVRHTLTANQIGENKATAVAARLRSSAPFVDVHVIAKRVGEIEGLSDALADFHIVIDCTAQDDVLDTLAGEWWPTPKLWVSASTGFAAKRAYIFTTIESSFPVLEFQEGIRSWVTTDHEDLAKNGEVLEGAGCWSPLYPARLDDIWLAAVVATKAIERRWQSPSSGRKLEIFEVGSDMAGFHSFAAVDSNGSGT